MGCTSARRKGNDVVGHGFQRLKRLAIFLGQRVAGGGFLVGVFLRTFLAMMEFRKRSICEALSGGCYEALKQFLLASFGIAF